MQFPPNAFDITVTRDEAFITKLFINTGTDTELHRYILKEMDKVVFYVIPMYKQFNEAIFLKVFDHTNLNEFGDVYILLDKDDLLKIYPGQYQYMIKVFVYNGLDANNQELYKVSTVTSGYKFIVKNCL